MSWLIWNLSIAKIWWKNIWCHFITLGVIFSHLLKLRHHFRIYYISFQFLQLQSLKLCFCLVVFCKPTYRFKPYFNILNQIMRVIWHFLLCGLEWSGDFNNLEKPQSGILNSKVHTFWEGRKILRNLHRRFVLCSASQIYILFLHPSQNIWTLHTYWYYKFRRISRKKNGRPKKNIWHQFAPFEVQSGPHGQLADKICTHYSRFLDGESKWWQVWENNNSRNT